MLLLDREQIAVLLPHHGAMVLLDAVLHQDADGIVCQAQSHHDVDHPMRLDGNLDAVAGVEYAAQAVALHRALLDRVTHGASPPRRGYLSSIRTVKVCAAWLDRHAGALQIEAQCLAASEHSALYAFVVRAGEDELLNGRMSVALAELVQEEK